MKSVLIVKTGTTVSGLSEHRGDFERWIMDVIGDNELQVDVASVYLDDPLPPPDEPAALIITGSAAMVTDLEPWSENTARWLQQVVRQGTPVLGICYGHQLLAHALGGKVDYHPHGREIGTVEVCLTEHAQQDSLYGESGLCFPAHVSHSQTVVELPEEAVVLGQNTFEPHHAVRFAPNCWGVQYHPEFDEEIMAAYIRARSDDLRKEGLEPDKLLEQIVPAPKASSIMRRFIEMVQPD